MKELVFLLEERSAEAMLEGILPRLLPDNIRSRCIAFSGKQDLEKQIVQKIRGYQNPEAWFLVLRDQDFHPDCKAVKARLVDLCMTSGRSGCLVRIACRELEAYYLADLSAVERGLEFHGLSRYQESVKFRNPDHLGSPSKQLEYLTKGRYQKVGGSRAIGPMLDLGNERSASFRNLISGIRKVIASMEEAG